jgi:hypothetical protein
MAFEDEAWSPADAWVTADDLFNQECACDVGDDPSPEQLAAADLAVAEASAVLYVLSARTIGGLRTDTIAPQAFSACTCPNQSSMGACGQSIVALNMPVNSIIEVKIGEDIVDPSEYEVWSYRYLVRKVDANGTRRHWPYYPRMDGYGLTFTVQYVWGINAPVFAQEAALELACMFFKIALGERITIKGLQSVSINGASFARRAQLVDSVRNAIIELPAVERFMDIVNPTLAPVQPLMWSPDVPVGGPQVT